MLRAVFSEQSLYRHILHKYANEDVSLGSWFIGLDVEHIDDRRLCCGTPPGMIHYFPSIITFVSLLGTKRIKGHRYFHH